MSNTYVYTMYGLGGAIWSGGMEQVFASMVRKDVPNVVCPPTRNFGQWKEIVAEIKKQPQGSKTVVAGHSMGAGAATYVTDHVNVDLVVLFDCAGQKPSLIGKNTGRCLDIHDVGFDINPNFRVQAVRGHEKKIERWTTRNGHTNQDDDPYLMKKVIAEINKIAGN